MKLKHLKTLLQPQSNEARISAIDWSANNKKMAISTSDRVIILYDENGERRDRFATKSSDTKYGKKNYIVTSIAFSPDSSKLAVGQSDNIVYVYKLGDKWDDKKSICNKFPQPSSVTCLIWPLDQPIVLGLSDGKVRLANVKTNKSHTIYNANQFTVALSANINGKGFISGHADGAIIRYFFDNTSQEIGGMGNDSQGKVVNHSCPPYALGWGASNTIIAAGHDKRIVVYNREGRMLQQFDFSRDLTEKEFTVACVNPSGQSVVIGSYDKLRIINWSPRKGLWDEGPCKEIVNLYTISALSWKKDGSKLTLATVCGGVELFECCLKKVIYKGKFELNYVGPSQVIVNNVKTNVKVVIKSYYGHEIDDVKITGKDRYIIAHTSETLMIGDMKDNKLSEIPWVSTSGSGAMEKFLFDHENVCLIYKAGELTFIEYGLSEVLGCIRTEFTSAHHISVRINERKQLNVESNKKLAYLIDLKTVAVMDLVTGFNIVQITNNSKIDWIELNETGNYLLIRDRKLRLQLCDLETTNKLMLLNFCSYVQWVPGSDVIVAQTRDNLCIWYNLKCPDNMTTFPLKGDVVDIVRNDGKTEVVVNEGTHQITLALDEGLIEFQTALDDGDFGRAVMFLESIEYSEETESMWRQLAEKALENNSQQHIYIAERCYAALGDICKTQYLHDTIELMEAGAKPYKINARLALLSKKFREAEQIYLENNQVDEAINMYKSLFLWKEAIDVASRTSHPNETGLRSSYYQWLMSTGQYEQAGEIKEAEGNLMEAISLYLKNGSPARAAKLASNNPSLTSNFELINRISQALMKLELYDKAGELYEVIDNKSEAMKCYRKGNVYQKAVDLARHAFPSDVTRLEEEWGNYLMRIHQMDNAIQHFIESGSYIKALEAAVAAKQWQKVATILENQDRNNTNKDYQKYYQLLGQHFASIKKLDKAEEYMVKGNCYKQAINLYADAGVWDKAYSIASKHLDNLETKKLFEDYAKQLESEGKLKDAERLYLTIEQPDEAIEMYKRNKNQKDVLRLINKYTPDVLDPTVVKLAEDAEKGGNYRQAEQYYLQIGDWKSAFNMYRRNNMWEDAYRVSQTIDNPEASKQVAYLWAKHLGGESAIKLLNRLGLLDKAIEYACEHSAFEFAFELSKSSSQEKIVDIHSKYAMFLEDEGRFSEAEDAFIKAKKPREAVLMWVHQQDWNAAQRVAELYDSESVSDVLVGQARFAFTAGDFKKAESYLIRAQRPELSVKLYRDADMWQDAFRVCKEYVPHKLEDLQQDHEREMAIHHQPGAARGLSAKQPYGATGAVPGEANVQELLDQGRQYEIAKQYLKAVEMYLKVNCPTEVMPQLSPQDLQNLEKAWIRAGEISLKYLANDQTQKVIDIICPRLMTIQKFILAADFYKAVDRIKDAINSLIDGEEWTKAREMAREINPKYEAYVDEKYKKSLKTAGKAQELENLDIMEALNMYADQGNWEKCLNMAQDINPRVLHKYLAKYSAHLIKSQQTLYALNLYIKYGAPSFQENFNIYKRIFSDMVGMRDLNNASSFHIWAKLRDFLMKIVLDMTSGEADKDPIFEKMLIVVHFYATRSAMVVSNQNMKDLVLQITIALLRYTDIIPADKAFYEAGVMARDNNQLNMAFVLLNHYLDLSEAIEDPEGSADILDNSQFEQTDIPLEVPLPTQRYTTDQEHNEIKEWVLSVSMDQSVEQILPTDKRGLFIGSLTDNYAPDSPFNTKFCMISGFPVLPTTSSALVKFRNYNGRYICSGENLQRLQTAHKLSKSQECGNVLQFINEYCGLTEAV